METNTKNKRSDLRMDIYRMSSQTLKDNLVILEQKAEEYDSPDSTWNKTFHAAKQELKRRMRKATMENPELDAPPKQ